MNDAAYDEHAAYYDAFVASPMYADVVLPTVQLLLPLVTGLRIADVACGQGVVARELAGAGASVVGIDASQRLLAIATAFERTKPLGITYVRDDAQTMATQPDASFDGAVCCMALMDMPDVGAAIASMARVLKPEAWLALLMTHPCFEPPQAIWEERPDSACIRVIDRYLTEGHWYGDPQGLRGRVGAYHRTLASYLNSLASAGFVLEEVIERRANGPRLGEVPGNAEIPSVLAMRLRKARTAHCLSPCTTSPEREREEYSR